MRVEPVRLVDVVEDSLVLIRPPAEQKSVRLRVVGPEQPVELHTDARKLRQILVDVLANAVKYTDAGSVVLVLRVAGYANDVRVTFEVTDTGRGIAAADWAHVSGRPTRPQRIAREAPGSGSPSRGNSRVCSAGMSCSSTAHSGAVAHSSSRSRRTPRRGPSPPRVRSSPPVQARGR